VIVREQRPRRKNRDDIDDGNAPTSAIAMLRRRRCPPESVRASDFLLGVSSSCSSSTSGVKSVAAVVECTVVPCTRHTATDANVSVSTKSTKL
jgi:hypothetical protein